MAPREWETWHSQRIVQKQASVVYRTRCCVLMVLQLPAALLIQLGYEADPTFREPTMTDLILSNSLLVAACPLVACTIPRNTLTSAQDMYTNLPTQQTSRASLHVTANARAAKRLGPLVHST